MVFVFGIVFAVVTLFLPLPALRMFLSLPMVHWLARRSSGQWHRNPPRVLMHLAQGSQVEVPSSHSFSSSHKEP